MSMDPMQLGYDQNYEYSCPDDNKATLSMPSPEIPRPQFLSFGGRRFKLGLNLFHRAVIVSRGTICWVAEDVDTGKECVVKDSWRASWRTSEGDLLELAHQNRVFAMSTPIIHGNVMVPCGAEAMVDSIRHVRQYLTYDGVTKVVLSFKPEDGLHWLGSSVPTTSVTMSSKAIAPRKRKLCAAMIMPELRSERKMARLRPASTPLVTGKRPAETTISEEPGSERQQRKVPRRDGIQPRGSKPYTLRALKSRDSKRSHKATAVTSINEPIASPNTLSEPPTMHNHSESLLMNPSRKAATLPSFVPGVQTTEYSALADPTCPQGMYMDMTHSIIVTNLVGERIEKFTSQRELLEGMRDAIKCTSPYIDENEEGGGEAGAMV